MFAADSEKQFAAKATGGTMTTRVHNDTNNTGNKRTTATKSAQESRSDARSAPSAWSGPGKSTQTKATTKAPFVATVGQTGAVESVQSKSAAAGKSTQSSATIRTANKRSPVKGSPAGQKDLKGAISEPASGKMLANETAAKKSASNSADGKSDKGRLFSADKKSA